MTQSNHDKAIARIHKIGHENDDDPAEFTKQVIAALAAAYDEGDARVEAARTKAWNMAIAVAEGLRDALGAHPHDWQFANCLDMVINGLKDRQSLAVDKG